MRMVANNIFGDSINFSMSLCFFAIESFNLFLSFGLNANNATSEPEIRPEQINKTIHDRI